MKHSSRVGIKKVVSSGTCNKATRLLERSSCRIQLKHGNLTRDAEVAMETKSLRKGEKRVIKETGCVPAVTAIKESCRQRENKYTESYFPIEK
ncbi:hypothetical protein NDU88_003289 [Pleurodeles waltl]|uniref:Uncharacterized protein n=1 Tax=Pleurodeles waltl TaxID=8319 RepID=A0AAV7Q9L8_PLEWA|nr:hypothetical protein NDU88_003289 [Pleurodeles waltl]